MSLHTKSIIIYSFNFKFHFTWWRNQNSKCWRNLPSSHPKSYLQPSLPNSRTHLSTRHHVWKWCPDDQYLEPNTTCLSSGAIKMFKPYSHIQNGSSRRLYHSSWGFFCCLSCCQLPLLSGSAYGKLCHPIHNSKTKHTYL